MLYNKVWHKKRTLIAVHVRILFMVYFSPKTRQNLSSRMRGHCLNSFVWIWWSVFHRNYIIYIQGPSGNDPSSAKFFGKGYLWQFSKEWRKSILRRQIKFKKCGFVNLYTLSRLTLKYEINQKKKVRSCHISWVTLIHAVLFQEDVQTPNLIQNQFGSGLVAVLVLVALAQAARLKAAS